MKVSILLDALTGKFETDVNRASKRFNRDMKKMQKDAARLGKNLGLAGAAAAAAAVAIVKAQATNIDALAKTSDVVGLSIETLQSYRHAGDLLGISNQGIDDSFRRLNRRAGEFANSGAGPAAKAFEQLGISVRDANGKVKSSEKLFEEISVAMQGVETDSQRAALAAQLFGDDFGPKLVPFINQGIDGVAAAREELTQLGALITESEAAGVERMNDAMTVAGKVGTGLAQKFTVGLAPAITAIAEAFIESSKESGDFESEVAWAVDSVVSGIGFVLDVVDLVGRAFKIAANIGVIGFEGLKVIMVGLADIIVNGPTKATNELIQLLNKLPGVDIDYRFAELAPSLKNDLALSASIINQARAEITDILLKPMPSTAFEERLKRIRAELADLPAKTEASVSQASAVLQSFSIEGTGALEPVAAAAADIPDVVADSARDAVNSMSQLQQSGANALTSFITGTAKAKDAVKSLLAEIANLIIQQAIMGSFGGGSGGGFSLSGLFTRDSGGRGSPGNAYVINPKAGPEIFIPDSHGTFIPNADRLGGGGNTYINNINLPATTRSNTVQQAATATARAQKVAVRRNS